MTEIFSWKILWLISHHIKATSEKCIYRPWSYGIHTIWHVPTRLISCIDPPHTSKNHPHIVLKFTLKTHISNMRVFIGVVPLLWVGIHWKEKGNSSSKIVSNDIHIDINTSNISTDIGIVVLDGIKKITNSYMFSWKLKVNVLSILLQLNGQTLMGACEISKAESMADPFCIYKDLDIFLFGFFPYILLSMIGDHACPSTKPILYLCIRFNSCVINASVCSFLWETINHIILLILEGISMI